MAITENQLPATALLDTGPSAHFMELGRISTISLTPVDCLVSIVRPEQNCLLTLQIPEHICATQAGQLKEGTQVVLFSPKQELGRSEDVARRFSNLAAEYDAQQDKLTLAPPYRPASLQ